MRILPAQLNPIMGDLHGNADKIINACFSAKKENCNLVVTPELSLWGYPPRDLLLRSELFIEQKKALKTISNNLSKECNNVGVLVGLAEEIEDLRIPNLYNSIAYVNSGGWSIVARKQLLPTYDVFDEKRYFREDSSAAHLDLKSNGKNWRLGITICEDLWVEDYIQECRLLGPDPINKLIGENIDILINMSASPFSHKKNSIRLELAREAAKKLKCPIIYVNQVGGNDELIFDGGSFALNSEAKPTLIMPRYKENISVWDSDSKHISDQQIDEDYKELLFEALVLGVKDYAKKCGFKTALLGLSGGIDSALVSIIAVAALGKANVSALLMPSKWNSSSSTEDALELAKRIGINNHILPISKLMSTFDSTLIQSLGQLPKGSTAENLQSRIRGTLLMALANQKGHLLLSTGNKSELAVGYCTLYGDMNGGLSVIGDLYKTCVFDLCNWLDSKSSYKCRERLCLPIEGNLIGERIRTKPPSAELREDQLDSDSLPDYPILDGILKGLIEKRLSQKELVAKGYNEGLVKEIKTLLKKSEFKRRQAPPTLKVSNHSFGTGWRVPIAAI
mgnify:CR=1 FL=1